MKNKDCIKCGNKFTPKSGSQKLCLDCRVYICKICNKKYEIKNGQYKRKYCSFKCYAKFLSGKYPANLNGKRGIKPRYYHLKKRPKHEGAEYAEWRLNVWKRDNFTCQICNKTANELKKDKIKICADHIKPFCNYPELRYEISNGRTLCIPCHKRTVTYGSKAMRF